MRHGKRGFCPTILSVSLALLGSVAHANEKVLDEVMVTATRSAAIDPDVAGTVTKVDRYTLERRAAGNLKDVLADEPDVTVPSDVKRFGSGTVNIRGIEDNRILMLVDGARTADFRSPGTTNYDGANRDLPNPLLLKQVEIVRGPASSLYGSDAIGGVIGFMTIDPADYLKDGKNVAVGGATSYHSVDNSKHGMAYVAGRNEAIESLVAVAHSRGHESESQGGIDGQGSKRTRANPQDYENTNLLTKFRLHPASGHTVMLTGELKDGSVRSDVLRLANGTSLSKIARNLGDDHVQRVRLAVDYEHVADHGFYDALTLKAYFQQQDTVGDNYQARRNTATTCSATTAGATNCDVYQQFNFKQSQLGASAVFDKAIGNQQFVWGLDLLRTRTEESKYTTWTNLATGTSSSFFLGEKFPRADYPKGHTDQIGAFVQDELKFAGGNLKITPGLRFDHFKLTPETDALYSSDRVAVSKSGQHVSPKLAVQYRFHPQVQVWGQFAEGYRAPTYEQVNRFFKQSSQFYAVVGNPYLEPETSQGFETGLRLGDDKRGLQLSGYYNRYKNFIDYTKVASTHPQAIAGYTTYLYQNLNRVTIKGLDMRGQWAVNNQLKFGLAWAKAWGVDNSTDKKLNTIEPQRVTVSAVWTPTATTGFEARLRAASRVKDIDDTAQTGGYYRPAGYGVTDIGAWHQLNKQVKLGININNVFDKTYFLWSEVRRGGVAATETAADFYSQPGRNASVTMKVDF